MEAQARVKESRPIAVVVDDSKAFLMYLSLLLNRMNLEVLPVTSVEEALEVCRVTRPNLMTMDMVMPDMDGLAALRAIRSDTDLAAMPVIMISSYQDKSAQWEALSLGCVDVLDKPVDLRRLHKAVQGCNLYPGGRRRYLRADYEQAVTLQYADQQRTVTSVTLSERGIFLRLKESLPKGTHVDLTLPLPDANILHVGGSVIYAKAMNGGDSVISPGIAVKFDRLTMESRERLSGLVEELLIADIISEQTEPVIRPS